MSVEIVNARATPREGGPPHYLRNNTRYEKSAKTIAQQRAFCDAYITEGTITHASTKAGVDSRYHYIWLERDPDYPEMFQAAKTAAIDQLEREARRRAIEGVEEPTGWYKGEPGGFVKRYSDTLLIFLLKGALPDKYKDRHEHTGKNGGPIEVQSTVTIEQFPVWLKQAIVVISSGIQIDPEVERVLMSHFEQKFLEAEKRVGEGVTEGQRQAAEAESYQGESVGVDAVVEAVTESVVESRTSEGETAAHTIEPPRPDSKQDSRQDYRPATRRDKVTLDVDDI